MGDENNADDSDPATGDLSSDDDPGNAPSDTDELDRWKQHTRTWERRAKASQAAEKERDELKAELSRIQAENKSEQEKALDRASQESADQARREVLQVANQRILKSELRAAAAGTLNDPDDAVKFLDLEELRVSDDGEVDAKAIASAIESLVKDKPYLGTNGKKPSGKVDGGARDKDDNPKIQPGSQRLAHAYASSGSTK